MCIRLVVQLFSFGGPPLVSHDIKSGRTPEIQRTVVTGGSRACIALYSSIAENCWMSERAKHMEKWHTSQVSKSPLIALLPYHEAQLDIPSHTHQTSGNHPLIHRNEQEAD